MLRIMLALGRLARISPISYFPGAAEKRRKSFSTLTLGVNVIKNLPK
jgi:hypothetical protein